MSNDAEFLQRLDGMSEVAVMSWLILACLMFGFQYIMIQVLESVCKLAKQHHVMLYMSSACVPVTCL